MTSQQTDDRTETGAAPRGWFAKLKAGLSRSSTRLTDGIAGIFARRKLDDEALAIQAVERGAQDYLVKGQVGSRSLSRVLRYAIERKYAQERITHLDAMLRAVRGVNQLILEEMQAGRYAPWR